MPFDLQPTDEQRVLQETLHDFAAEALRPAARECESAHQTSEEIFRQAHEIGVTAPVDESYGGAGLFDAVTHCIVAEELAWGDPGIAYYLIGSGLAAVVVGQAGTDKQKQAHLPAFGDANPVKSFVALGEKIATGDLESLDTAVDGDKVSGTKYGVLNATDAALGIVVGRTGDQLGAVLVDASVDLDVVKPEDKLGLEAAPTSVVNFALAADAIPSSAELTNAILRAKLLTGALAVGCARASLEYASQYAIEREAFGKPIGAFQGISFKIAEMAIEVDAARLSVWRAAWKLDRGEATLSDIAEANGQALSAAVRCGDDGVQVLGGHGYIRDHPVEKWFRDAVTLSVFDAPDAVGDMMVARGVHV
ncbi:MAG: butyryl-CoA dehydrogenase [Actinomycetota bacterium]|jgi:alkylation response protein AidB-like acyl-CoA dehydrogenase|nr:butyryl-CoA dehydrogenase [Actinomycetota bacterium]